MPRNAMLEVHTLKKLHRDKRLSLLVVDFVDSADVGMIEGRGGFGFAFEAGQGLPVHGDIVGQEFEGNESAQLHILGFSRPLPSRRRPASQTETLSGARPSGR